MRKSLFALAALAALGLALPAAADGGGRWHGHGWKHGHHHGHHWRHRQHRHGHGFRGGVVLSFPFGLVRPPAPVYRRYDPPPPTVYYERRSAVPPGAYCREYTRRVVIAGVLQEAYGTACLQPDGTWQMID